VSLIALARHGMKILALNFSIFPDVEVKTVLCSLAYTNRAFPAVN
jgi:hypothetical protein